MLTENEKTKLIKDAANIFVAAGGVYNLLLLFTLLLTTLKNGTDGSRDE